MTPIADMIEEMMEAGAPLAAVVIAVRNFELARDAASRDASRDGRDGKALAAERARKYRARQREKSGTYADVPRETSDPPSRKTSRDASRQERDDALILSSLPSLDLGKEESKKEETKVVVEGRKRSTRRALAPLPTDWMPSDMHLAAAKRLQLKPGTVESKAEDMRIWAQSNDIRKANWDATFHGFLRRAASENGASNGYRGPRSLQDPDKSISAAAGRLAEQAERGEFSFGPRPSLLPDPDEDAVLLLPQGRGARS